MKPFSRRDRVSALIQQTLSDILHKEISDPRLELVTITGVKMSADLKTARIYFSVTGGSQKVESALKGFERATGYIKRSLGSQLDLRYMPKISFFYDESFDYGAHIEKVLKTIHAKDNEKDNTPPETE